MMIDKSMIKIVLGSCSELKKYSVQNVLKAYFRNINVCTFRAKSLVPETPWDQETYDGARNRALDSLKNSEIYANYYVGLESGLIERYGTIYEECWCVVIDSKGIEHKGYSSGLSLPTNIVQLMIQTKKSHDKVMKALDDRAGRVNNDDTWGTYSSWIISRKNSLEESVRNAFVPIISPKTSLYKLEHEQLLF